jgi:hypothetical protein
VSRIERTEIKSLMDIKEDPFVSLLEICKLDSPVLNDPEACSIVVREDVEFVIAESGSFEA